MITISCIVPVKDGAMWLPECLDSLVRLEIPPEARLQVSAYNDGSTDKTETILEAYRELFEAQGIDFVVSHSAGSRGVGYAKNRAVQQSGGEFLCFCDADDIFLECRVKQQLYAALASGDPYMSFIGGGFTRFPEGSTLRYTKWANSMTGAQLRCQVYTSHGPTVVAPTWFISRRLYDLVGGFCDSVPVGYPEDLRFFFDALKLGAKLIRVSDVVTVYRYHANCASLDVSETMIWDMRVVEFSNEVLSRWKNFTIWNAGKQGKRFFKSLSKEDQRKAIAFCDVDEKKIGRGYFEQFDSQTRQIVAKVPIIPVSAAVPPVVICVKMDLTSGVFEQLLSEKDWQEGVDYYHLG